MNDLQRIHPSLERVQQSLAPGGDAAYFAFHKGRFARQLSALETLVPPGRRVLDVGSHYLHFSSALRSAGYDVTAIDVKEFQELELVRRRASEFGVRCETVDDLGRGEFLPHDDANSFDCVVFCEILEHITFNPIRFWRRVYDLLKVDGFIYLTTPNSLRHSNIRRTLGRAAALRGVGIPVAEIFQHVTFGHHWKEYSAAELREYFATLSPDFVVDVRYVDFDMRVTPRGPVARAVRATGVMPRIFRPHLEAVIRVPRKSLWRAVARGYED